MRAWNLLGGIEWEGIDVIAEMLGIRDIEGLLGDLATIREWHNRDAA